MLKFLLFFFVIAALAVLCERLELDSFSICWFAGFSYITFQENIKIESEKFLIIATSIYLTLAGASVYAASKMPLRSKLHEFIIALIIGIFIPLASLTIAKAFSEFF